MKHEQTSILAIQLEELGFSHVVGAAVPDLYKHKTLPLFVRQSKTTIQDVVLLAYKRGREHQQNELALDSALTTELERIA